MPVLNVSSGDELALSKDRIIAVLQIINRKGKIILPPFYPSTRPLVDIFFFTESVYGGFRRTNKTASLSTH